MVWTRWMEEGMAAVATSRSLPTKIEKRWTFISTSDRPFITWITTGVYTKKEYSLQLPPTRMEKSVEPFSPPTYTIKDSLIIGNERWNGWPFVVSHWNPEAVIFPHRYADPFRGNVFQDWGPSTLFGRALWLWPMWVKCCSLLRWSLPGLLSNSHQPIRWIKMLRIFFFSSFLFFCQ